MRLFTVSYVGVAALAALAALAVPLPAAAVASDVSPTGFLVTVRQEVKASPAQLWDALGRVERWWNPVHSWSGAAANLSLSPHAGGCFCERWNKNSVEHGRVVYAAENSVLRLQAALGPLQAMPVQAILTFAIAEKEGKTILQVTYRVAGAAGLQELAGPVDGVIAEQVKRLAALVDTGKPE